MPTKKTHAKKAVKKQTAVRRSTAPKAPAHRDETLPQNVALGKRRKPEDAFHEEQLKSRSAGQAGSLQGLSNVPLADSESVDELVEEGNFFEAEVVEGVENARDADEGEVRTHELPEDDVPEEYRNEEP
jgi:hypothetical protein